MRCSTGAIPPRARRAWGRAPRRAPAPVSPPSPSPECALPGLCRRTHQHHGAPLGAAARSRQSPGRCALQRAAHRTGRRIGRDDPRADPRHAPDRSCRRPRRRCLERICLGPSGAIRSDSRPVRAHTPRGGVRALVRHRRRQARPRAHRRANEPGRDRAERRRHRDRSTRRTRGRELQRAANIGDGGLGRRARGTDSRTARAGSGRVPRSRRGGVAARCRGLRFRARTSRGGSSRARSRACWAARIERVWRASA